MLPLILLTLCGGLASPASELEAAANDAKRLPRSHWRYVSLFNIDPQQRSDVRVAVDGLLNHCSRADVLNRVESIPCVLPDGSQTKLLRFDLSWYCRPETLDELVQAWEELGQQEPYFTPQITLHLPQRVRVFDRHTGQTLRYETREQIVRQRVSVSPENAAVLERLTGSRTPIVRADWLLAAVGLQADNYFRLAGIPATEEEFCAQFGVDQEAYRQLRADVGANVLKSDVTQKPRRISFRGTAFFGVLLLTRDPNTDADPQRDPIRNPHGFVFDGTEGFARGAHGLLRFWTGNAAGRRVNLVPAEIAPEDYTLPRGAQNRQIVAPLSCIACHNMTREESGFKAFSNDQLRFMRGQLAKAAHDPVAAADAAKFYGSNLSRLIVTEREAYADAVTKACGATPYEMAAAWSAAAGAYQFELVTPESAACELGLSLEEAERVFATYATQHPDHVQRKIYAFGLFLDGQPCSRGAWEATYPFAFSVTSGLIP